jgi:hypothetical protein
LGSRNSRSNGSGQRNGLCESGVREPDWAAKTWPRWKSAPRSWHSRGWVGAAALSAALETSRGRRLRGSEADGVESRARGHHQTAEGRRSKRSLRRLWRAFEPRWAGGRRLDVPSEGRKKRVPSGVRGRCSERSAEGHRLDVPSDGCGMWSLRGSREVSGRRCVRTATGGELVGVWQSSGASVLLGSWATAEEPKVSQPEAQSDLARN